MNERAQLQANCGGRTCTASRADVSRNGAPSLSSDETGGTRAASVWFGGGLASGRTSWTIAGELMPSESPRAGATAARPDDMEVTDAVVMRGDPSC